MKKLLEWGGVAAAIVLIAFGVGALVIGANGRSTVRSSLAQEQIAGSPDSIELPTADIAGKPIDTGDRARAFASYMRIHALAATGGLTYSQMPRFATADGKGTSDPAEALTGPTGQPLDNPLRNLWISETALSTALNTSYMAEQVALFGIVVGVAMLLSGIGFLVLTLGGALRGRGAVAKTGQRVESAAV
jgi:hypothetical protein